MQFFDNSYINGTSNSYVSDSTNKGVYGISDPTNTASNEQYAVNNIYDMAGNMWEWTMEAYGSDKRVFRGGGYSRSSTEFPASSRGNWVTISEKNMGIGIRITLYIN